MKYRVVLSEEPINLKNLVRVDAILKNGDTISVCDRYLGHPLNFRVDEIMHLIKILNDKSNELKVEIAPGIQPIGLEHERLVEV